MSNIDDCLKVLKKYISADKIKQMAYNKYLIDMDLILFNSQDVLPIYLVEIDKKLYLADYGYTTKNLNLSLQTQQFIKKILENHGGITYEEGNLLLGTNIERIYLDLNYFIMAIMLCQSLDNYK